MGNEDSGMDILTLNYEFPPLGGGASPVSKEMAVRLADRGHNVDVVTMHYGDLPQKQEINDNLTVYRVPSLRSSKVECSFLEMLSFLPLGLWKSMKLTRKNNYDLNHTHFVLPTGLIAFILQYIRDLPYVITSHGSDVPGFNPNRFTLMHALLEPLWEKITLNSQNIISPSEYLSNVMRSSCSTIQPRIIANGIDYKKYSPDLGQDKRILLTGRLFERKNVQDFLDAIQNIDTDWKIVITGEGPYRETLERKASNINVSIEFRGWVEREELDSLLETSQIYVFPSSHENCPVALQEAMASGNAIITSEKGGAAEMIGESGIVVDTLDSSCFAEKISMLIENREKREVMARKARERLENRYDWKNSIDRYMDVFNSV